MQHILTYLPNPQSGIQIPEPPWTQRNPAYGFSEVMGWRGWEKRKLDLGRRGISENLVIMKNAGFYDHFWVQNLWVLPTKGYGLWVITDLWVMVCKSLPTNLVDPKWHGISGVMGYQKHGLRGFQLYMEGYSHAWLRMSAPASSLVFKGSVQSGFLPRKRATVDRNWSRTDPDIEGTEPNHLGPVFCGP
ncbi:uncharacterized protein LACBIDRAFT_334767 [Laccaria bicolor S238N-H82]|uniref:Predicted protein n=1 Tax=Laccaria bicolor (strain S238N-H82 / ATCC MYA-4686) TaxID=486041 RepID=B0E085_LACBS|nr:uncharacterized protein LACBIDRAFT_334767 [Laccaria bicolor S238N-H82]EDQ99779.1 predicted protein [Laccaria bicolor S238N-H82]|eukprot:XP_001889615.1 predicted protein [Laccaria bicolor S238N-H82]